LHYESFRCALGFDLVEPGDAVAAGVDRTECVTDVVAVVK
jgi:hypothetical protein